MKLISMNNGCILLSRFLLPPSQKIETLDKLAGQTIEHIQVNNMESEIPISTRISLLPKLVSGEIRVQEF